jgi:serine/threonine protein kinase
MPSRIGHYAIRHTLGAGGMGVVYEAYDERLARTVALKMMLSLEHDETARKRFWREARAAASVNHPARRRASTIPTSARSTKSAKRAESSSSRWSCSKGSRSPSS